MLLSAAFPLLLAFPLLGAGMAHAQDAGVGDVYVTVASGGGLIYLDGATTGIVAPGVVRSVPQGTHTIRVDDGCKTATADVTVRTNAIERVNLSLATGTGTIRVVSSPPETVVTEGKEELGTGTFGPLPLACGSHTLVGTAPGRQTLPYTVEVPLRGHVDVTFDLPAAAIGGIAITPTPFEASVWVDGIERGTGPMTVEGLPAGVHTVGAKLDGYLPREQEVTVVPYQIVRSTIELTPKPPAQPLGKRMASSRVRWGRVGVNIGVSALAVGLGALAWVEYDTAVDNYGTYAGLTYADDPDLFYDTQVAMPRTLSYIFAGTAGASAVTAGVLWATTTPRPEAPAGTLAPSAPRAPAPPPAAAPPASPSPSPNVPPSMGLELRIVPAPNGLVVAGRF